MFNTPILLITFNRPSTVGRVLEVIMQQSPRDLYVFQDGARIGNTADLVTCAKVREVIEKYAKKTDTKLHTFFSNKNLGCGLGPAKAISWFFDNVDQGIILEDDCIPHLDFFAYAEELLNKYRDDNNVAIIGGCNYGYKSRDSLSYDFGSGHHQTWGWASWRRVWKNFDYSLSDFKEDEFSKVVRYYYKSYRQRDYWRRLFQSVKKDRLKDSCWDYQFYFSIWRREMVAIYPCVNLVSNIGYGDDATHTNGLSNGMLLRNTEAILPLSHPSKVQLNHKMDSFMMRKYIIPYRYGFSGIKGLPYRLNSFIKYLVGHQGPWFK